MMVGYQSESYRYIIQRHVISIMTALAFSISMNNAMQAIRRFEAPQCTGGEWCAALAILEVICDEA